MMRYIILFINIQYATLVVNYLDKPDSVNIHIEK